MGVHLMGVHLTGMHLIDVYLTDVHLIGVYLTGVHLMGVSAGVCFGRRDRQAVGRCHGSGIVDAQGWRLVFRRWVVDRDIPGTVSDTSFSQP
jgi:hypothetical protein